MTTTQRVRIAFDDIGAGDPTVVLVHGLFENRSYYRALADHLTARRRVLNIDLRGHGESEVPDQGYSLDILAEDVIRVCEQAGVTRAVFCGHSFPVALRVVLRRPDLAAGLVMLDGAVLLLEADRQRLGGLVQVLQTDAWRDALLGFFGGVAAGAADRVRADISAAPRVYAAPILREIASTDFADEVAAARCPLMYVHGHMPLDLERLRALRPDAVIETIPNVGHYLMLTAPHEVNTALDRFLDAIG
jgi:pimeloyl-ACP methyl ester carboxylesterase